MMSTTSNFLVILAVTVILASINIVVTAQGINIFDVTKYGAEANGQSDTSQALTKAWKDACASAMPSQVYFPRAQGSYLLGEVRLSGPCKAPIQVHVQGDIVAPDEHHISGDAWVTFVALNHFTLSGTGSFNGRGQPVWKFCKKNPDCKFQAVNIKLASITDGLVQDIRSIDSKTFHVKVNGCKNLRFKNFRASAPGDSVNTDGIHISKSTGVNITDTNIASGDDCISMGEGSQQVWITRVNCGPGHGISIGSLGKVPNEEPVSGIHVRNCTLSGTTNGVRIKSWPAQEAGIATDIHFEEIIMVNVANPVIIDQNYCPHDQCKPTGPSKVKISKVRYEGIRGSSSTRKAISLDCSSLFPCQQVVLSHIDLKYPGPTSTAAECANVKPIIIGQVNPAGC